MALGVSEQSTESSLKRTLLNGSLWVTVITAGATIGGEMIRTTPHRTTAQERCVFAKSVLDDGAMSAHLSQEASKRLADAAAAAIIVECLGGKRS